MGRSRRDDLTRVEIELASPARTRSVPTRGSSVLAPHVWYSRVTRRGVAMLVASPSTGYIREPVGSESGADRNAVPARLSVYVHWCFPRFNSAMPVR
jgi:hypothetical protein